MDAAILSKRTQCREEWLRQEAGRLYVYRFLHTIYSYPNPAQMHFLREFVSSHEPKEMITFLGVELSDKLLKFIDIFNQDSTKLLMDLEIEYTRLFINSFNGVPVKPYESVYLNEGHMVYGEATINVEAFYQSFGVCLNDNYPELPDHFSIETEFVAFLLTQELKAYSKGENERGDWYLDGQIRFLQQHLLYWAWHFSDLVHMHSQHPVYHEAGLFSKDFFNFERKFLCL